jgi:hypothetical protein
MLGAAVAAANVGNAIPALLLPSTVTKLGNKVGRVPRIFLHSHVLLCVLRCWGRRYSSRDFSQDELGDCILETVLQPGDLLYLPRGTGGRSG